MLVHIFYYVSTFQYSNNVYPENYGYKNEFLTTVNITNNELHQSRYVYSLCKMLYTLTFIFLLSVSWTNSYS